LHSFGSNIQFKDQTPDINPNLKTGEKMGKFELTEFNAATAPAPLC
jgi:hypothetical protein